MKNSLIEDERHSDRNSYNNIVKAIGLFGGVKVFTIIIAIAKSKLIAMLLGPTGMGIVGLYTSTTSMISSFTGMGLGTSAVRDVSSAFSSGDSKRVGIIVTVVRKLVWFTGILGLALTFILAPRLSLWAFENLSYTNAFRILSVILLFDQLTVGQTVLMQGTFNYGLMARSTLIGSVIGFLISIPFYFMWGEKAIIPVLVICSLCSYLTSLFFSKKINLPWSQVPIRTVLTEGRIMMTLGFVIAATATIRLGGVYIQRLCISNFGDISDVGLFVAGSAIATQYIDVILGSMSSDYTPRLASVSSNLEVFIQTINRQIRLMLIIILPAIVLFLIFSKQLIIILYSNEFLSIVGMIKYMMLAMFFRTISWCISFSFVALGESKTFFWNETLSTIYSLAFSVIGFIFCGFEGLGLAFLATYLCYTFQMYFLAKKKFSFVFERDCLILIIRQFILLVFSFLLLEIFKDSYYNIVSSLLVLCIIISITYKEFNKVVSVNLLIRTLKNKFKKW